MRSGHVLLFGLLGSGFVCSTTEVKGEDQGISGHVYDTPRSRISNDRKFIKNCSD